MAHNPPPPKHDHKCLDFPKGFLWGAATSSFQVEGNNTNSDWWAWEQENQPVSKRSGKAADQYNLYEQDFDMASDLGHKAHRLSIEWSRIEPREGEFNQAEIDHYAKVLKALKARNLKVMLTLWHFSNPQWVTQKGGWENGETKGYFERFVQRVVPEFKDYVDLWITLNEPTVLVYMAYLAGLWPPNKKSIWAAQKVYLNLVGAHNHTYQIIHQLVPNAQVGTSHNVSSFEAFHRHSLREEIAEWGADLISNHLFYILTGTKNHDFLGLNYYFNRYISFNGESAKIPSLVDINQTKKEVSDLGWEIYPEGMFDIIMDLSDYHLPIYITENGIASTNDDRRVRFLLTYLKAIFHAIHTGVDVRGYFHWSLIDNYEWLVGFDARFGLVEVDFKTQKRTPRPSALVYRDIIEHNGIPHHLLKLLGHSVRVEEVVK